MPTTNEVLDYEAALSNEQQLGQSVQAYVQLLGTPVIRGPVSNSRYLGQGAMITGNPYDPSVLDNAAAHDDAKAFAEQQKEGYYQSQMNAIQERIKEGLSASEDVLTRVLATEQERITMIQKDMASPVAVEKAYVNQAAQAAAADQLEVKAHIAALANDLVEMTEQQGLLDKAGDFLGYFFPFGEVFDIQDIQKEVSKNPNLQELAGADLESVLGAWKGLSIERQQALWPYLKQAVIDATATFGVSDGNILKASSYLQEFLAIDGASELRTAQVLDVALSAADVVPVRGIRALAAGERLGATAIMKRAVQKAQQDSAPAKVATDTGDIDSAAAHTIGGMQNEQAAASLGTTTDDAAMSATPIKFSEWMPGVVDDPSLPSAVADKLNEASALAEGYSRTLNSESSLMQLGILQPEERHKVVEDFFEMMERKGQDYLTQNLEMGNLEIVEESAKGFSYRFTLKDKNVEGAPEVRTGTVQFRLNQVTGSFEETINDGIAQSSSNILSPASWARFGEGNVGDFRAEVTRQIQAEDLKAAYVQQVSTMLQWAAEPVMGATKIKSRKNLDLVLEAGDQYVNAQTQVQGRVFTPTELMAGVNTKAGTVRLNRPDEIEAYYRTRMFADTMFQLENQTLFRELELGGYKNVKMFSATLPDNTPNLSNVRKAAETVARPYESVGQAVEATRDRLGQGLWDDSKGQVVDITEDVIRQAYDEGDIIVRMRKDWNTKGTGDLDSSGELVEFARVKPERVGPLPEQVLNYRHGYVPKINEAKFMVAQKIPAVARGRSGLTRNQALRGFDSLQDAQLFRENMIAKFMKRNNVSRVEAEAAFPAVEQVSDLPFADRLEEAVGSHAGLYHGTRSKDEILFGLSGQQMSRVSPLESLQRYTAHVGTFRSTNELRIARERRWLNTVRKEFPDVDVKGFNSTAIPTNTAKGRTLERIRQQIREWNGIPTNEESLFAAQLQRVHDWSLNRARNQLGFKDKESVKSIQWLMHTNPISALKAAVMHNLLGFFNPAQLYTQASGALIAVTKNPKYADAIVQAHWFHVLDNVKDQTALGRAYEALKADRIISQDVIDAHQAYARTGLTESVFNNADLATVTSTGLGVTNRLMRNADNLSLLFYRGGELINRRLSFLVEYKAWRDKTGKATPNDFELSEILAETNKNMLELNAANKAWWQGGHNTGATRQLLGLATQFLQVGAKTLELVFKGEARGGFTLRQKRNIILGQTALFGAAGVPLGSVVANLIMGDAAPGQADSPQVRAVEQGFVGFTVNAILGSDLDISQRFTLGEGITQTIQDFITSGDPIWLRALGPSASGLGGRVWDSLKAMQPLIMANRSGEKQLSTADISLGASILAQIPSTGRSYWKWNLMHNYGVIVDRHGRELIRDDFDYWTEIGVLIGFQPSRESNLWAIANDQRTIEDKVKDYADARIALMKHVIYNDKLDPEVASAATTAMQMIDETSDPYVVEKGLEMAERRIFSPSGQTYEEQLLKKFFEQTAPSKIQEDYLLDSDTDTQEEHKDPYTTFKQLLDTPEE